MKYAYVLVFSLDACKALPSVGSLFQNLNGHLSTMVQRDTNLGLRVQFAKANMSSPEPLSKDERTVVMKAWEKVLNEQFPELSIRCDSMRRKPRKSRSQPV